MGKIKYREVIDGHATVTQVRKSFGKEYTVEEEVPSIFGPTKYRKVTKRKPGYLYVSTEIYSGPKEEGEPVAEWELPVQLRYSLDDAAKLAVANWKHSERRK